MSPSIPLRARAITEAVTGFLGAGGPLVGAEIGVLQGAVAGALLWAFPKLTLYLVDPYAFKRRLDYEQTGDYVAHLSDADHEINREIAVANVEFAADRVRWVREFSPEAIEQLPPLDFVFIDADHSFAGCTADVEACYKKMKRPGLLAGHDYNFPPVKEAVDLFAAREHLPIEVGDHATWWAKLQ